jgi:Domain of unknown function (DUF3846)
MNRYKGMLVETDGKLFPCFLKKDEFIAEARQLIDGWIEIIYCPVNGKPGVILVDEEGSLKHLPVNVVASIAAGKTIVGPAIILNEVPKDE